LDPANFTRQISGTLVALAIGLGLGGVSAWYALQQSHGLGGISVGEWAAWPFTGGKDADPYTVAKVARNGTIPLGATEGLAFEARVDNQGRDLDLACDYSVSGVTPPSKLWTIVAYGRGGEPVTPSPAGTSSLYSGDVLRFPDGSFRINVSRRPRAENWLAISGSGTFHLVLRVYDTPITSTTGLARPQMPVIIRGECHE